MPDYTVTITEEEEKALTYIAYDVQDYIDNMVHNRARKAIDEVVAEYSDKQPKKLSKVDKEDIVKKAKIKTAKEKSDEITPP